tara:strand:+ start:417 stop:893 length:477 start_codon:yes stop_codon:yes gene_type:complete
MATKEWAKDSFWESFTKDKITTILTMIDDDGVVLKQNLTVNKYGPEGDINTDFEEIVATLGEEKITDNTSDRQERKIKEREENEQKRLEQEKSKELQRLFEAKIQSFEIESIKNSQNRELKSKLRKAQNIIEVNIYSMMIVMEQIEIEKNTNGTEESE